MAAQPDDDQPEVRRRVVWLDSDNVIDGDEFTFATQEQAEDHHRTFHRGDSRFRVAEVPAR